MTTKIYHGSVNKIEKFDFSKCMWFSSNIEHANEAILMQDNFQSEGEFGYVYMAEIDSKDVVLTDDFSKFDDGTIFNVIDANIIRTTEENPEWYVVKDVTKLTLIEI